MRIVKLFSSRATISKSSMFAGMPSLTWSLMSLWTPFFRSTSSPRSAHIFPTFLHLHVATKYRWTQRCSSGNYDYILHATVDKIFSFIRILEFCLTRAQNDILGMISMTSFQLNNCIIASYKFTSLLFKPKVIYIHPHRIISPARGIYRQRRK